MTRPEPHAPARFYQDLEGITGCALPENLVRLRSLLETDLAVMGRVPGLDRFEELCGQAGARRTLGELVLADFLLRNDLVDPCHPHLLLRRLAAEGSPLAEVRIALAYLRGEGIREDPEKAAACLQDLAGPRNLRGAQFLLARCYEHGTGVSRSDEVAAAWYRAAAVAGHREAMVALGILAGMGRGLPRNHPESLRLLEESVELGSDWGLVNLAGLLFQGRRDGGSGYELEPDPVRAVPLLARAADLGVADMRLLLGDAHHTGRGVPSNQVRALEEYRKAAPHLPAARYMVAYLLLRGMGAPPDLEEAVRQLEAAAERDHPASCYQLGILAAHGCGVPRDPARAADLLERAAAHGHPEATHAAAVLRDGAALPPPAEGYVVPPPPRPPAVRLPNPRYPRTGPRSR